MIRVWNKKKHNGVILESNQLYSFGYANWEHDRRPTGIFVNAITGRSHTGANLGFIQFCNLHYIPYTKRLQFANVWLELYQRRKRITPIDWKFLVRKMPFLMPAFRRYLLKPTNMIFNIKKLDMGDIESVARESYKGYFISKSKMKTYRRKRR